MRHILLLMRPSPSSRSLPRSRKGFPRHDPAPERLAAARGSRSGRERPSTSARSRPGAVYRGDLRTGKGARSSRARRDGPRPGSSTTKAGSSSPAASTGKAFVYDARPARSMRELQLATGARSDVHQRRRRDARAAYFTDSNRAVLYRLGLEEERGRRGAVTPLPLTGDFQLVAGFNLNGIDATPDGKTLLAVQTRPGSSSASTRNRGDQAVDLGGCDAPERRRHPAAGRTLYVVQNQLNRIAVVYAAKDSPPDVVTGRSRPRLRRPDDDRPVRERLYAVNARFGTTPSPTTPYTVVQVRR